MPIASKAAHRSSSPRVPRNDVPGLVIMEIGYAVNHTEDFWIAARGSGLQYGFCHVLPWPEKKGANLLASSSIHRSTSQLTYAELSPLALPVRSARGPIVKRSRSRPFGRSRLGRAGERCSREES